MRCFILAVITAFALQSGPAQAQTRAPVLRDPGVLQNQQDEEPADEDTPALLDRRILDLHNESQDEAEQPRRGRGPASNYGTTCDAIESLTVSRYVIRLQCAEPDRYGNTLYSLAVGDFDPDRAASVSRMWMADRLIDAVYQLGENPRFSLSLRVYEERAYEPYIDHFDINFSD
jgi:hypothetical protein